MPNPSRAVFLSYASEDADAAQRICDALRAAGIEVWFDRSELRGGDAWDRQIHEQIHDCRLFVPVISANSERRDEGYFRREWLLAVDRTRDMTHKRAFLVPVVIDGTPERGASVPDKFHDLQWTRLPGGETSPAFIERIHRLLSGETTSAPASARPAGSTDKSGASATRGLIRRRMVLYAAVAVAVVISVGYFALERRTGSKAAGSKAHAQSGPSIAVLPLANESGDASQQYFSDGISEDLITALSQFPGLKVIGRTSAFQFRDSKEDSRSIGAKLGVAHLLEGSVRKSGDVIRVSAELVDTADGSTQWSEHYDRPFKDLFVLQDEITHVVAGALRTKLLLEQRAAALSDRPSGGNLEAAAAVSDRPPGGNLEAYSALLQGRFYFARHTEADFRKAIESYGQATQLDRNYALAWSGLARAWTELAAYYLEGSPARDAYAEARKAADRALALAPELAAAHVARGYLLHDADFDWHGAEGEFRRAAELAPNDSEAKFSYGAELATGGDVERAIELTQRALATEPLRADWYWSLAMYLGGINRLNEANRAIERAIELQPSRVGNYTVVALIEVQRGDAQAALVAAQREFPGPYQDMALALARQIGSDRAAADAALATLIGKYAGLAAYEVAQAFAIRKSPKETFEWLDRALTNRDPGIPYLLYDPFILRYKDDPRFAAFCRKVGLPVPGDVRPHT